MERRERAELMARLNRDARRIATHFGLSYRSLEAERANVKRRYGICYDDGSIRIRLRHATTGQPLKYSSLVNTLCHELAHLRHFNHGPRFKAYYLRLLEWARREAIYRPGHAEAEAAGWVLQTPRHLAPSPPDLRRAPKRRRPVEPRQPAGPCQLELFGS